MNKIDEFLFSSKEQRDEYYKEMWNKELFGIRKEPTEVVLDSLTGVESESSTTGSCERCHKAIKKDKKTKSMLTTKWW